ncbi:antiterminator LoaP [Paenibacillus macquariensis]|uniref:Acyl carrier protein n=1 Tax=Paenibacillus macquariensis TaxID=948756 RepID=A0ABY1K2Q9_9BACL|nr:antiterminator LoaP [Paenibacillus macquariensis]MEC0090217.1 antiterminator LoaP [Paenibacillus macquariensis]OAB39586.1 hypothetical protein PMSM_00185 [Paenibacillus macquariensis subsp. macquariensis]SIR17533.1 acyl carrier protein [Paenibacillus macquariensis]
MRWYGIFVQSGKEEEVKINIYQRLGTSKVLCCVPKRKIPEKKNGIICDAIKTIFPGYVFIQTDMDNEKYYKIKSIPEIIKILNYRNKRDISRGNNRFNEEGNFKYIPDIEMENIIKIINENDIVEYSNILFRNDKVLVISGPLKGMEGNIQRIDKHKKRAKLSLEFMGSQKLIDIGIEIIRPTFKIGGEFEELGREMMMNETKKKIEDMIIELMELPQNTILNQFKNIGINSLTFIRLIVNIESVFGVEIPDNLLNVEAISCVDDVVSFIEANAAVN